MQIAANDKAKGRLLPYRLPFFSLQELKKTKNGNGPAAGIRFFAALFQSVFREGFNLKYVMKRLFPESCGQPLAGLGKNHYLCGH